MTEKNIVDAYHNAFRGIILIILALALLLVLPACTKQQPDEEPGDETQSQLENMPAQPNPTTFPETDTVQVALTEDTIEMTTSLSAGPTVFTITNTSDEEQGFKIEGQGTVEALNTDLMPGDTLSLFVDLRSGTYTASSQINGQETYDTSIELRVHNDGTS